MNTYQLIEALREEGYIVEFCARTSRTKPTMFAARFWDSDHHALPWVNKDDFDKAIHSAAMKVIERDGLDIKVIPPEKPSEFLVWVYGILWGMGIMAGLQILVEALR